MTKTVLLQLTKCLVFLTLFHCSWLSAAERTTGASHEPLKIAVANNVVPYQFIDNQGKLTGYVIEFWELWSQKTGVEIEFVSSNWADSISNVRDGHADVHGALAFNSERAKFLDFGGEIYSAAFSIYVHKDLVGVTTIADLNPHLVGMVSGTAYRPLLLQQNPDIQFRVYKDRESFFDGLRTGDVKTFVNFDYLTFRYQGFEELSNLFPPYKRISVGGLSAVYGVRKGDDRYRRILDSGLDKITEKDRGELEQRWFGLQNKKDALLLGLSTGNEPYMSLTPSGEATGLFVDIWKKWAEKTQTSIEFMPNSMDLSLKALQEGKSNIHIGYPESRLVNTGLPRAKHLYSVYSNLFVKNDFDLDQDLSQLDGEKVGLFETAPYKNDFVRDYPNVEVVWFEGLDAMLNAAVKDEISGFVAANQLSMVRMLQNNVSSLFRSVPEIKYEAKIYSIVNSDNEILIEKIEEGFELIRHEELVEIENRWINDEAAKYFQNRRHTFQLSDKQREWLDLVPEVSVGIVKDWHPYEYLDEEGVPRGISIDVFNIAEEMTGQKFNFVAYDSWDSLIEEFKVGEIDMVANISATDKRRAFAEFTSSYWHTPWSITTHKSVANVDSILNFFGKRLALIEEYQMIQDIHEHYPEVIIQVVQDYDEAISLLKAGVIDGVLDNMLVSAQYIQANDLYQFKIHVIEDLPYDTSHMGIRAGMKLQTEIMERVVNAITEEDRKKILNERFKVDVVQGVSSKIYVRNIVTAIIIATIIVVLVLLWNNKLKQEIRKRIAAETKLKHLASHDPLTALPNRALLMDRLNLAVASHKRNNKCLALMFIDLDGFKQVNDSFGHDVGDELLKQVAARLSSVGRVTDTVARFGGDEFVVMVTDLADLNQSAKIAEKIIADFSEAFDLSVARVNVGASIGIAAFPDNADEPLGLIKAADNAMYKVKEMGKNSYVFAD